MIPEAAKQAAVAAIEFHLPDSAYEKGCALRCGYNGDDLATHLVEHILNAATPHMGQKKPPFGPPEGTTPGAPSGHNRP